MSEPSDWRLGAQPMLQALGRLECTELGIAPSLPAPRVYRRFGRLFVAESALPSLVTRLRRGNMHDPILLAAGARPWSLQVRAPFLPSEMIASAADVIRVKSNLRAFYAREKITVKVANPNRKGSATRLAREGSILAGLVPGPGVRAPKPSFVPIDPDAGFVVEELLDARPVGPKDFSADTIAKRLLAFIAANRLEMKPLADVVCFSDEWRALADFCESAAIVIPPEVQQAVATQLNDTSLAAQLVPCAMCHFDLTRSNLMHSDDMLFIVDWEWGAYSMIFVDAIPLSTQIPEFANCFMKQFESLGLTGHAAMLDTERQFFVAAIYIGSKRVARRADFAVGHDASNYEKKLKRRIIRLLDVCAQRLRRR